MSRGDGFYLPTGFVVDGSFRDHVEVEFLNLKTGKSRKCRHIPREKFARKFLYVDDDSLFDGCWTGSRVAAKAGAPLYEQEWRQSEENGKARSVWVWPSGGDKKKDGCAITQEQPARFFWKLPYLEPEYIEEKKEESAK